MENVAERAARFRLAPPNRALRFLEARAPLEAASLVPLSPWLLAQPRGDGRQVMVLPGFGANDTAMWPLRRYLRALNYDALPWGLGVNKGRPFEAAERVAEQVEAVRTPGQAITLVGWSLGGVIARLVARARPEAVREVITFGTPVEGGPKYTATGSTFAERREIDLDGYEQRVHGVNSEGVSCPLTVIYSRSDGIVQWRAAVDRYNSHVQHVRVPGSHLGLAVNPAVWRVIARKLAGCRIRAVESP